MKIILPSTALAAILGLALAGVPLTIQAQTTVAAPAPAADTNAAPVAPAALTAKPKKSATTEYAGKLTAIDPAGASITVTGTKRTLVLVVTSKTKFKPSAPNLAAFAVGDKVSGSYTKDASGTLTAYSIHKKKPKSTASTTAPAAPATPAAAPAPAAPATPAAQ